MRSKWYIRAMSAFLAVMLGVGAFGVQAAAGQWKDFSSQTTAEEMQSYLDAQSYANYLAGYANARPGSQTVSVDITNFTVDGEGAGALVSESPECSGTDGWQSWFGGDAALAQSSVYLASTGKVTWTFNIPVGGSGMYAIAFEYFTLEGTINSIQRKLHLDGSIPFSEASYLDMTKMWTYAYETDENGNKVFKQDINGNDLTPVISQDQIWRTYICSDSSGYYNGYFQFYLSEGQHTLTLEAAREATILKSITLIPSDDESVSFMSYDDYIKYVETAYGAKAPTGGKESVTVIQAETPDYVSDSSVYMTNDRTSAINTPSSPSAQLYNVIGANSYNSVGQWAAYTFTVPESGLYDIVMRFKQNGQEGMYLSRTIKLWSENRDPAAGVVYGLDDGTPVAPFEEAYYCRFDYSKDWQTVTLHNDDAEFQFYFEAGKSYTMYMEVSLGGLADLIRQAEESLSAINNCYMRIIQLTGADPDEYRDYKFSSIMPDVLYELNKQAVALDQISRYFEEACGTKGAHVATLDTVARLLATMGQNEYKIAGNLSNLKSYLGTLGTWINTSKSSALTVDSFTIQPSDVKLPKAKANFFQSAWFEICSFFMSFFTDYDSMGVTDENVKGDDALEVWLATGRDQSKIWRSLIDADTGFTAQYGAPVTLKLVTAGTLLPSVLADKGPDVYLGLDSTTIMNYAIRDAIMPVGDISGESGFSDFDEVVEGNYHEVAMNTVTLLGKTYGLPLTMGFPMMFYRLDVLVGLGLDVPETWDEMIAMLPVLQQNNLDIGITYTLAIDFFLYQNGGSMWLYEDDIEYAGAAIGLGTEEALSAFKFCCRLYTDYSFPVTFDAQNRFRTGEMPLVIQDYTTLYNQLTVFATEIQGLWEFSSIPGTVRDDGTFNYDSMATITATIMMHGCKNPEAAWEFMKWQTSADVEAEYGNRMVALIGPSAKYNAANLNTIEKLSWTTKENAAIQDQLEHMASIVNYPGSYIIARYTNFAFLDAANDDADPVDALQSYINTINVELSRKREELGLKVLEQGQTPDDVRGQSQS